MPERIIVSMGGAIGRLRALSARLPRRLRPAAKAGECLACDRGVSAVEFSLLAPMLAFSLLSMVDLGLGIGDRLNIEHVLRAGAQSALTDPGPATVDAVMRGAAETNFSLAGSADPGSTPITLSTVRFCACPESPDSAVACLTVCAASEPTFIFYQLTAEKTFTTWFLPPVEFDRSIQIQVR